MNISADIKKIGSNERIFTLTVQCMTGINLCDTCIRVIEISESDSLYDLHDIIQDSVNFGNDHPFEFYLGRNFRNKKEWITHEEDWDKKEEEFQQKMLKDIYPLKNLKLYYWFDFGDQWIFEMQKSRKIKYSQDKVVYPRIIESIGPSPEQYIYDHS